MSVKAIDQTSGAVRYNQQSFTGSFNPVVLLMDGIDKGGFAASFIAQDGIGMVAPRIYEGLNRNRATDENGKKTGPLNWEFARREGIREMLSGPSAFLIPLGIMGLIKKYSGTANNVHVNHIEALGENFAQYAGENASYIDNVGKFKKGYYTAVFRNVLDNSTDNNLTERIVNKKADEYAEKLIKVENLRADKKRKEAKKLYGELVEDYTNLRKSTSNASVDEFGVTMKLKGNKTLDTNISRLTQSLTDYTNDAYQNTVKYLKTGSKEKLAEFINKFNKHRAGTRVFSNLGMWSAVVGFYALIPKLYNMGLKQDPGLKGLETENNTQDKKDVAFTGAFTKAGEAAMKSGGLSKLLSNFEFNGASMSVPAMLTLLFGFCLPTRYTNAKSDKERKEILVRDISSFIAILFGAKALSRAFSGLFAKISGLALNIKPQNHKGFFNKFKNYLSAGGGIEVLNSSQIVNKYSNVNKYRDGIQGFFNFLNENGGDLRKVLKIDPNIKSASESIMKRFGKKSLNEASVNEITEAFGKAKGSDELATIEKILSKSDNKLVNRAKTLNSAFGFASTLVLVPVFMMWLARYCERMTKRAVEKEKAEQAKNVQQNKEADEIKEKVTASSKPVMAGFLNGK